MKRSVFLKTKSGMRDCVVDLFRKENPDPPGLIVDLVKADQEYAYADGSGDTEVILQRFADSVSRSSLGIGEEKWRELVSRQLQDCRIIRNDEICDYVMEWSTSPGWPFNVTGTETRKKAFEKHGFSVMEDYIASGKKALWSACVKSEVLKRKKILEGKMRLFSVCPLHVQQYLLKYCADFNTKFIEASRRERLQTWIGRTHYHGQWHSSMSRFADCDYVFSLDEVNWDIHIHYDLFRAVYRLRSLLTENDKHKGHFERLCQEVVCSYLISDQDDGGGCPVIMKEQGNSSGSSNTIVDNSLIVLLLVMEAYFEVNIVDSLDDFLENVEVVVIGDDNLTGVRQRKVGMLTEQHVMDVMHRWRIQARVESVGTKIIGAHFVSKDVGWSQIIRPDVRVGNYVPVPSRVRLLAHVLYGSPGFNFLQTGLKVNSLMLESYWDPEVYDWLKRMQNWIKSQNKSLYAGESESMPVLSFYQSIFPDWMVEQLYLGHPESKISVYLNSSRYNCDI